MADFVIIIFFFVEEIKKNRDVSHSSANLDGKKERTLASVKKRTELLRKTQARNGNFLQNIYFIFEWRLGSRDVMATITFSRSF